MQKLGHARLTLQRVHCHEKGKNGSKNVPIARYIRFYCIHPVKIQQNMFNMSYIYAITGAKSSRKKDYFLKINFYVCRVGHLKMEGLGVLTSLLACLLLLPSPLEGL
jgi:hypothetical protein